MITTACIDLSRHDAPEDTYHEGTLWIAGTVHYEEPGPFAPGGVTDVDVTMAELDGKPIDLAWIGALGLTKVVEDALIEA